MLTDEDRAEVKAALDSFPGNIKSLPQSWLDIAFEDFSSEQQEKILYEFGLFLITGAKAFYKEAMQHEFPEGEILGDYLGNAGASFFKAAYELSTKLAS